MATADARIFLASVKFRRLPSRKMGDCVYSECTAARRNEIAYKLPVIVARPDELTNRRFDLV